jgi:predicted  nucleic acid-binding Zn-ribbon protein
MSTTETVAKLKEEQNKIEKLLEELEQQKKTIDKQYAAAMEDENKVYEELRKCRDTVQYNRLQIHMNAVSRRRKQFEAKKQEVERRLRGYQDELERVKARIDYMKPKGNLISHKKE